MWFYCSRWFIAPTLTWGVLSVFLCTTAPAGTVVRFDTVLGSYDVQLFDNQVPVTVANFLGYVNTDRYDGTVVHRNASNFVIQGGGFTLFDPDPPNPSATISFGSVNTDPPILDEPSGGAAALSNVRGTIAMAKSGPDTVTSQWFVNEDDNSFLDDPARPDGGFTAFGKVLGNGMDIVDAIGALPVPADFGFTIGSPFGSLPLRDFSGTALNHIRVEHTVTVNNISQLVLTPGDLDRDGIVDASDLAIWKSGYGIASGAFLDDGDADMDGDVDGADFLLWQRNFGAGVPLAASHAVPEPGSGVLAFLAGSACLLCRRRLAVRFRR